MSTRFRVFLARSGGEIVGRSWRATIEIQRAPPSNVALLRDVGIDDQEVANALFDAAAGGFIS